MTRIKMILLTVFGMYVKIITKNKLNYTLQRQRRLKQ